MEYLSSRNMRGWLWPNLCIRDSCPRTLAAIHHIRGIRFIQGRAGLAPAIDQCNAHGRSDRNAAKSPVPCAAADTVQTYWRHRTCRIEQDRFADNGSRQTCKVDRLG